MDIILNHCIRALKSAKGQTLIQVLVTVGIMGIIMAGMMTLQSSQAKESRAAAERIAKLDAARVLNMYFADPGLGICTYEFVTLRTLTFDDTHLPATATASVSINSIHSGTSTTSSDLIAVGKAVSPISNSLVVQSISVGNITGAYPNYSGSLIISFNSNLLVRGLANLTLPIKIVASGATNIKTIQSCASVGPSLGTCQSGLVLTGYDSLGNLVCNAPVYQ